MRGANAKVGDTRVSANGYHYTRVEDKWRLTHHLVMEKFLGRALREDERVSFKDKDRRNLKIDNLHISIKKKSSAERELARLEARRDELQARIDELRESLE